ncbi:MAG: T9SS type A sorting domain-containing protein [Moheibacter sp.]
MSFRIIVITTLLNLFTLQAQYSTPNANVHWTLDSIALHSPSTISVSGTTYTLHENLLVEETDSLLLDKSLRLEIDENVEIEVKGYFFSSADNITITATNTAIPYKGFWFYDTAEVYFNNTLIEYGGGIRVITPNFLMEHCEITNHVTGSASGGAITFSNGSPIIRNSIFLNNQNPAISSAANSSVSALIEENHFEGNNQTNNNRPQINMGPSGDSDSLRIFNNTIIGDRDLVMVGGVASSNFMGITNKIAIRGNTIRDNRYGITALGATIGIIENNIIDDNNTEVDPMNGGSGISLYNTDLISITNNKIRRNLWGITLIGTAKANLGSDDTEDLNPGLNVFGDNENNGKIYALYNNTTNLVKALHNCWIEGVESTATDVEEVIFHQVDDTSLGEVLFDPFNCGVPMEVSDLKQDTFKIYPNPANQFFYIESKKLGEMKIYNLNGKQVHSQKLLFNKNKIIINLPKGLYLVEFEEEFKKLVIQ